MGKEESEDQKKANEEGDQGWECLEKANIWNPEEDPYEEKCYEALNHFIRETEYAESYQKVDPLIGKVIESGGRYGIGISFLMLSENSQNSQNSQDLELAKKHLSSALRCLMEENNLQSIWLKIDYKTNTAKSVENILYFLQEKTLDSLTMKKITNMLSFIVTEWKNEKR